MANYNNFRPTLLVGVGGTGSKIAESILAQAIENDSEIRSRIGILALDTDSNDMKKLDLVPDRSRIRFSQPETVYRLLERNASVEGDWSYSRKSPEMSQDILGMSLIEGAGQIRMLTRLALHDAFVNGRLLDRFERAISELAVHADDQAYDGSIHILIVGSLAGATGSGSFAQVALALKQAARNRGAQATVRGVFLLPDVYARTGTLPPDQVPNVLANGFASLKELNAINVRAKLPQRQANFKFEYLPGHDLMDGSAPFEAVTFIDYENTMGGSMGRNIDAYVTMAGRTGYLMIFSPLGARYGSVTINDIRQKLSAVQMGSTNLYSGIGVAAVKYPAQSMRTFLGRRMVLENLRGDWTRLDVSFRSQLERYKQEAAAGRSGAEEPKIEETYLRDLAQLAREEPRVPFFRNAYDFLFPETEDEKTFERKVRPRHVAFCDQTVDYVDRTFWAEGDMAQIKTRLGSAMDTSSLLDGDSLVDTVRRAESELDRCLRALDASLQTRPDDIYQNTIIGAEKLGADEWAPHHIQSVIVRDGAHPVAVRAFLYLARAELEKRRAEIDVKDLKLRLFRIADQFRDENEIQSTNGRPTVRSTSRVIEQATKAEEGSIVGKILGRKKKAFAEDYAEYYNSSLTMMRNYAAGVIAAKAYDQAIAEINALVRVFEGLFVEIEAISGQLGAEINTEKTLYNSSESSDGNAFVYANGACKEDAWARLSMQAGGLRLDTKVNQQLVQAVYSKHREDRLLRQVSSFKALNELFWTKVVTEFGQGTIDRDFSRFYDMSVVEAVRLQFEVEDAIALAKAAEAGEPAPRKESFDERFKRIVDRAAKQAQPYLSFARPDSDGQPIKFWAVHPDCKSDIGNEDLFSSLFSSNDGENPIVEKDFSKSELVCVSLRVNVQLQYLTKLAMGDAGATSVHAQTEGRLARSYNEMVARMNATRNLKAGAEFTPHVDRTWHIPGALPEIFMDLEDQIAESNAKGFVIASLHDLIKLDKDHGQIEARFSTRGRGLLNAVDEVLGHSHDPWVLQSDFESRAPLVTAAIEFWSHQKGNDAGSLESHPSFGLMTKPEKLFSIMQAVSIRNRDPEDRDEAVASNVEAWIDLLGELIKTQESSMTPRAQKAALQGHVDRVRGQFYDWLAGEGYKPEIIKAFERAFDVGYDRALAV